jgi:hypothetical protein
MKLYTKITFNLKENNDSYIIIDGMYIPTTNSKCSIIIEYDKEMEIYIDGRPIKIITYEYKHKYEIYIKSNQDEYYID